MNPKTYFIVAIAILVALFGIKMAWSSFSNADKKAQHVEIKLKDDFTAQLGAGAAPVLQGAFRGDVFTDFDGDTCDESCKQQNEAIIDPSINIFLSPNSR